MLYIQMTPRIRLRNPSGGDQRVQDWRTTVVGSIQELCSNTDYFMLDEQRVEIKDNNVVKVNRGASKKNEPRGSLAGPWHCHIISAPDFAIVRRATAPQQSR